jgi:hypothetical protein
MMEIPGVRLGKRYTQLWVLSVEDLYVLLAIKYMIISMFTGGPQWAELLLYLFSFYMGVLADFIYATSLGFYKSSSRLLFGVSFLGLLHIGPSRVW